MKNKPNIIFIMADDMGSWAMGCAGNNEIRTPNIDSLAAEGIRFVNFFCTSPVCSPARASLMTGRIPSQHGILDWLSAGNTVEKYEPYRKGELIEYLKDQPGYTDYLAEAGYKCGISGKWHLGDSHHPQKSFEFWEVHAKGGGPYYDAPLIKDGDVYEEPKYITDKITENALLFLEEVSQEKQSFYLSIHYTAPHGPWNRKNHPEEIYDDYHENCAFESVPDGLEPPEWVQERQIKINDSAERREALAGYYTAVTAMDRNIGRILEWLEDSGLRKETLIIFTSDNGMNMGHHGLYGKGNASFPLNMFDESVKVPFIMSQPGIIPSGIISDAMLSQYDFLPTVLEYAGIDKPQATMTLPGKSFAGILKGLETEHREDVVVFDEYGPVRMVRTTNYKYIHRYPYGPHELYDLKNDPGETKNLADSPESMKIQEEMRKRLTDWFRRYVMPGRNGSHEAVTGLGQRGLCGAQADGEENFTPINE